MSAAGSSTTGITPQITTSSIADASGLKNARGSLTPTAYGLIGVSAALIIVVLGVIAYFIWSMGFARRRREREMRRRIDIAVDTAMAAYRHTGRDPRHPNSGSSPTSSSLSSIDSVEREKFHAHQTQTRKQAQAQNQQRYRYEQVHDTTPAAETYRDGFEEVNPATHGNRYSQGGLA